ncbi:MAG TPA: FKBP-type peptidyl-prolyl cis-trans isomerase [Hyphomonadaceae bacterium]|jgi:FKBP-type peptidyl-prolyl cis-trans isomerase
MIRYLLAGLAVLLLAACQPALKINAEDPWASLHPWNHGWKEVQKLPNGVEYVIIRKGDGKGAFPNAIDQVEVQYEGRLAKNGEVFDSSYERGEPATFPLNRVIPGWTEGLQKMQPGDEFMFWIPWDQAYGEEGQGPIPAKADLMFRVELIKVTPAVAADQQAWAKVTPWPTDSNEVVRKTSGLEYMIVESGDENGLSPDDNDFVYVHLEGRLEDGSLVDSTYETQAPLRFPMADLTPGWAELMKGMRPGDHWMVRMPPNLMYGAEGDGRIPANANVIFEVRLDTVIYIDSPPDPAAPSDPADPR